MELSQCLFCSEHCDPLKQKEGTPLSLLGRQLKAVFVLRELLRLPPDKLTGFLESSGGDHPHEWIRFCDTCQRLVEEAFSLFEQMVRINRKLRKVQVEAVKKVRESQSETDGGEDSILKETQEFVKQHDYGSWENPFVAGDWEAEWRVEQLKAVKLEKDVVVKEEIVEGYLDDDEMLDDEDNDPQSYGKRQRSKKHQNCTTPPEKFDPGGTCPVCGKSFPTTIQLKRHLWNSSCKTGVLKNKKVLDSEKFVEESTGKIRFRCTFENCGKILKHHSSLMYHKKKHANPKPCPPKNPGVKKPRAPRRKPPPGEMKKWRKYARQCPHCPYLGPKSHVDAHVKRVHEGGQYPLHCELCGQGARNPHVLRRHQAQHHFICGVQDCGVRLESQEQLHGHQVDVHGREVNLFKCDECDKLWITRTKLETHREQVHRPKNAETQHICDQCGKTYAFKVYLQNHVWDAHKKLRKAKPKSGKTS